jgi:hypothetical protein
MRTIRNGRYYRDPVSGLLVPPRLAKPSLEIFNDYAWNAPAGPASTPPSLSSKAAPRPRRCAP